MLKSVTTTNPGHAPGWIASARLEEVAGRVSAARKVIKKGCRSCPENPDVWLEAARLAVCLLCFFLLFLFYLPEMLIELLQTSNNAKIILAKAVRHIPHSVKLWLQASNLESDLNSKRRVLRKGIASLLCCVRVHFVWCMKVCPSCLRYPCYS